MPQNNMNLDNVINQSEKWVNTSGDLVDGIQISTDKRTRVAAALFHLSMEHHGSIHVLITKKHYGSAFALLRPQFEAFVRGAWFQNCASDEHLIEYMNNSEPPKINKLISEIEATPNYVENTLKEMKKNAWSSLCGYTHGGFSQVINRTTATEVSNDYSSENIVNLINQSSSITLLTLAAIAALIDNEQFANNAILEYDEIFCEN